MGEKRRENFSDFVVKWRWVFLSVFVLFAIFGAIMIPQTKILYDLSAYAPANSNTEKAVEVMKAEFDDKGSAYVMVKNITEEEAITLSAKLASIPGVAAAVHDSAKDYKDGSALYTVNLVDYDATDGANAAIKGILEFLSDKEAYICGQSASSYYTRLETFESILKVGVVIAVAIILMLIFTSGTYFEIIVMLFVFGISVVINMGTNFFFDGISYVSNLVALVLQLALSLDYSVILLHRFVEERALADVKVAASRALSKGVVEILSSSLTTIAGLCALIMMTLPIGVEMGLALSKSIVSSLLSVIFLMPGLLVFFAKPIERTKHKSFIPSVKAPAKAILKARYIIVPVFIILIALSGTGQFFNKYAFNINGGAKIVNDYEKISDEFGIINSLVVIVPKGDYVKEAELTDYLLSKPEINSAMGIASIEVAEGVNLVDEVNVADVVGFGAEFGLTETDAQLLFGLYRISQGETDIPLDEYRIKLIDLLEFAYLSAGAFEGLLSEEESKLLEQLVGAKEYLEGENYSRIIFNIDCGIESKESLALVGALFDEIKPYYDEFYLAGESVACYDMAEAFPRDNLLVSVLTVAFVLIILLFTFKNFALPFLLILAIQGGIWINFVIPFLAGTGVSFIGYLLICAIQMGATIDYGIILTSRFRSMKALFPDKAEAMAEAQNAVYPTIITSGSILTITGLSMGILASGVVSAMGMLLGFGALISVLIVLFVLPSLLLITDKFVEKAEFSTVFKKFFGKKPRG